MNKVLPLFLFAFLALFAPLFGQAPQGFSYQAVACDANGSELVNQSIRVRASILKDGLNGPTQWIEIHAFDPITTGPLKTDQFGLFNLIIGQGQAQTGGAAATFSTLDWGYGNLWLKIEMDPAGGANFATIGAQRIFSVPYALYTEKAKAAETAATAVNATTAGTATDDLDKNPTNEIQEFKIDPATGAVTLVPVGQGNPSLDIKSVINILGGDPSATNELQGFVYDAATNTVSISPAPSGGNGSGSFAISDGDRDPVNEIQELKWDPVSGQLSIVKSGQGGTAIINLPGGELQKIVYDASNNSLSLSPSAPNATPILISDGDRDSQNELQKLVYDPLANSFSMSPAQLGTTPIAISDGDRDATNELQKLVWDPSTNILSIISPSGGSGSGSTSINIPGGQLQSLSYDGILNSLTLSPAPAGQQSIAISDGDRSSTNEIQELKWNAATKTLSIVPQGQGAANMNLPVDLSETNELQSLSFNANTNELTISPGTSGVSQSITIVDGDKDSKNELQSLSFDPNTKELSISPAPLGFPAKVTLTDGDQSSTNELQILTYDTLTNELKLGPAPPGYTSSVVKLNSIGFGDPGADVVYPNGLKGEYKVVAKNFIVPMGKTFYITAGGSTVKFKHPIYTGGNEVTGYTSPSQPIFPAGTTVTSCYCTGFLTEEDPFLATQIIDLNSGVFTVPLDKVLYIKSGLPIDKSYLNISTDGGNSYDAFELGLSPNQAATRIITIPGGTKIGKLPLYSGTDFWLTGYLLRL